MTEIKKYYLNQGLKIQNNVFNILKEIFSNNSDIKCEQTLTGSVEDMNDKVDIIITNFKKNIKKEYDVKSAIKYDNKLTYTFINSLGEKSKIYSGDTSIDLIFTFGDCKNIYFVNALIFKIHLDKKIEQNESKLSKVDGKSFYVWFGIDEIKNMSYAEILKNNNGKYFIKKY